jgi:hypothetical protein
MGWIGVDLDGTLAHYTGWKGAEDIGDPVPAMEQRVHEWLNAGHEVRIFTARASVPEQIPHVRAWLDKHFGEKGKAIGITNVKDFGMLELYDDRAIQVEMNTGRLIGYSTRDSR